MNPTRRHILASTALVPATLLLAACPAGTSAATLDAQILADATGVVSSLGSVLSEVNTIKPGTVSSAVAGYITDAQQLVAGLTAATPAAAGASTLQTIDTDISNVLSAVAPIAATIYPAAGAIIAAIQVVLPGIEAWVNPLIGQVTTTAAAPSPAALAAARKALLIPVVK